MIPAFRDFLVGKEWAQHYHRLKYVAKQLAISQSRASKDISLLCRKIKELSIEDWESRVYGLNPGCTGRTCVNEVISDDECVEMTDFLDETADWDTIEDYCAEEVACRSIACPLPPGLFRHDV
jgi:hypothetical protein